MKKQRERVTVYRLEYIEAGDEHVEEHRDREKAERRFSQLKCHKNVVEIEFVKVGPNGREGIDFWLDDAERERRLDECIASEGYEDEPPDADDGLNPREISEEEEIIHQQAIADSPEPWCHENAKSVEGLRRASRQRLEPDPAYEAAHSTTHDLIQVLVERLHDLPAPDGGHVKWEHVKLMNEVNRTLFAVIELVEKETK